jgi:hypothetical protein
VHSLSSIYPFTLTNENYAAVTTGDQAMTGMVVGESIIAIDELRRPYPRAGAFVCPTKRHAMSQSIHGSFIGAFWPLRNLLIDFKRK